MIMNECLESTKKHNSKDGKNTSSLPCQSLSHKTLHPTLNEFLAGFKDCKKKWIEILKCTSNTIRGLPSAYLSRMHLEDQILQNMCILSRSSMTRIAKQQNDGKLPKTNRSTPANRPSSKDVFIFQPSMIQVRAVSFREGNRVKVYLDPNGGSLNGKPCYTFIPARIYEL